MSAVSVSNLSDTASAADYTYVKVKSKSSNGVSYRLKYNTQGVTEVSDIESTYDSAYGSEAEGRVSGNGYDEYKVPRSAELQTFEAKALNGNDAAIEVDQDKNLGFQQDGTVDVYEKQNDNRVDYELHGSDNTTFQGYSAYNESLDDSVKDSSRFDADRVAQGFVKNNKDKWDMEGQFSAIVLNLDNGAEAVVDRDI